MSNVSTIVSDMPPAIADLDHELLRRLVLLFRERRRHQRTAGPASVSVEAEALRKRSPPGRGTLTGKAEVLLQRIHEYSDLRKREDSWDYINSALLLANWALRYDSCTRVAAAFGVEYLDDEFAAAELLGEYGEVPPATWKAGYPLAQYSAIYSPEPVVARGEPRECDGPIWDPLCPPIESIGPIADELLKQPRCARIVCLDCGTASFAQELSTSCPAATIENFCRCALPFEHPVPHYDCVILNLPDRNHVGLFKALKKLWPQDRFAIQTLVERHSRPSHEDWEGRVPYALTLLKPGGFLLLLAGRKASHGPASPVHFGLTQYLLKGQKSPETIWFPGSSPGNRSGPLGLPVGTGRILSKWRVA